MIALLELVLVLAIATFFLRLWKIDFSVPFNYFGDTLWFMVPVKGMLDGGWVYDIPRLSAPFGLDAAAFPAMTHLDWVLMKAIAPFASHPGTVLNVFWLLSLVLTAWSATLALRLLGARLWMAVASGIVYAFLPYALLRNVAHISLVYYCVPLLSLFAIHLARGCRHPQASTVQCLGYGAALAQGFNYIYFSFFAVLLFAFAGLFGFVRERSWKSIKGAAIACAIVIGATTASLVPSFLSWHANGKPPDVTLKVPQEAEIYGLKIRKMLAPHEWNAVPLLGHWGKLDKSIPFPNENENVTARLGPLSSAGLLLLLLSSLGLVRNQPANEPDPLVPIAALLLFSLLVATVGGFGAIFNEVFPHFRGYNRFSVFIAFLAIAGVALWWQAFVLSAATARGKLLRSAGFAALIVLSLHDQLLDAGHLNNRRSPDETAANHERELVGLMEKLAPKGASVFQMPLTGFPPDGGKERMQPYDHARPALWSTHLQWSWPSFSQRHRKWLGKVDDLEGAELGESLVLSGFGLVWIDRFGYRDNGDRVVASLLAFGATELLPGSSSRYVVLDLRGPAERLRQQLGVAQFARRNAALLDAAGLDEPRLTWGKGFYQAEKNPGGRTFRWSQAQSALEIVNPSNASRTVVLSFLVAAGREGRFTVSTGGDSVSVAASGNPVPVELPLVLKPGARSDVRFAGEMGRIDLPPGEKRDLHFLVMDFQLRTVSPAP